MKNKRNVWVFLLTVCVLLCAMAVPAMAAEYTISTAAELFTLATEVNGGNSYTGDVVKLNADIDLFGAEWTPIGLGTTYFKGEFDGQGHTIKNLKQTKGTRMGLFGLMEGAYLHDFTLKNVTFDVKGNDARVGAVAGNLQYYNVLEDVVIDGLNITVQGNDGLIGGVAGYVWESQLSNVDVKNANINVAGKENVVAGNTAYARGHLWDKDVDSKNDHWLDGTIFGTSVVQNLFVDCDVKGAKITVNGGGVVGGFFGQGTYNYHSNFFNDCHVTGLNMTCQNGVYYAGGFTGYTRGSTATDGATEITRKGFGDCSANGSITGDEGNYGGFVGYADARAHRYDDAAADVTISAGSKSTVGGFVGATGDYVNHQYTFENCVASGKLSGGTVGSFAGRLGLGGDGASVIVSISNCTGDGAKNFIGQINNLKKDKRLPVDVVVKVPYTGKAQQLLVGDKSAVFSQDGQVVKAIEVGEYDMDLSLTGSKINTKFVILPAELPSVSTAALPKTGDNSHVLLWATLMLASATLLVLRRRTAQ